MRRHVRIGQEAPPPPDPSAGPVSGMPYGRPYETFFPLLRRSGEFGTVTEPSIRGGRGAFTGGGNAPPGIGGPSPTRLSDDLPWLFPPLDAFPFVLIPSTPLGGLANGSSAIVVQLAQLPRGRMAVLQRFGNNASVLAGVTWTFLIRGQPTAPIINFPSQYGLPTDPRPLPSPGTVLRSGDDFQLQVTNNSGIILNQITALLIGYQWQGER